MRSGSSWSPTSLVAKPAATRWLPSPTERRILSGLPAADPPRDLSARVRTGIESGRFGPWWRRPGALVGIGASLATVAAAILAVVVFNNLDLGPVGGQASGSPLSLRLGCGLDQCQRVCRLPASSPRLPQPSWDRGELGYLSLSGAPLESLSLSFIDNATGASVDAGTVSGPPIAASLSPDGQWLAYITQKGETGANEVWALHLVDAKVTHVGCSSAAPFTNRLAWSPDSRYLAYTLVGVDLGADAGCEAARDGADVWLFDTTTSERTSSRQRATPSWRLSPRIRALANTTMGQLRDGGAAERTPRRAGRAGSGSQEQAPGASCRTFRLTAVVRSSGTGR